MSGNVSVVDTLAVFVMLHSYPKEGDGGIQGSNEHMGLIVYSDCGQLSKVSGRERSFSSSDPFPGRCQALTFSMLSSFRFNLGCGLSLGIRIPHLNAVQE